MKKKRNSLKFQSTIMIARSKIVDWRFCRWNAIICRLTEIFIIIQIHWIVPYIKRAICYSYVRHIICVHVFVTILWIQILTHTHTPCLGLICRKVYFPISFSNESLLILSYWRRRKKVWHLNLHFDRMRECFYYYWMNHITLISMSEYVAIKMFLFLWKFQVIRSNLYW